MPYHKFRHGYVCELITEIIAGWQTCCQPHSTSGSREMNRAELIPWIVLGVLHFAALLALTPRYLSIGPYVVAFILIFMAVSTVGKFWGVKRGMKRLQHQIKVMRINARLISASGMMNVVAFWNLPNVNEPRGDMRPNDVGSGHSELAVSSTTKRCRPYPAGSCFILCELLLKSLSRWSGNWHSSVNETVPRPGSESRTEQRQPRHETETVWNFCFSRLIQSRASILSISPSFAT